MFFHVEIDFNQVSIILMSWYVTQTGFDPVQDLWSGECTLVSPSVWPQCWAALDASFCLLFPRWAKFIFREILTSKSQLTRNPLLTFLLPLQSWSRETELVVTQPNQRLFIQVNHALMHECSHSESPSSELHRTIEQLFTTSISLQVLNGAVEKWMPFSRSSHWFAYLNTGLMPSYRQLTLESKYRKTESLRMSQKSHKSWNESTLGVSQTWI